MSIDQVIDNRNLVEVLHFTTNGGLAGSLHSGFLKSRKRLPSEVDLKYIYKPNAQYRKDVAWLDNVSLSLSRINAAFFRACCRWHREEKLWWCILSFDSVILTHPGVTFVTTNNIYPSAIRGTGAEALESLFAETVRGRYNVAVNRSAGMPASWTTCEQAEVLYPGELSMEFLRRIYVASGDDQDEVQGLMSALGHETEVLVAAERFGTPGVS